MTRRFALVRYEDLSGVSGVGIVAEGTAFSDGTIALQWVGSAPAVAIWPNVDAMLAVHGHGGRTVIHWIDEDAEERTDRPRRKHRRSLAASVG